MTMKRTLAAAAAWSQTASATLSGVVEDEKGAVVPGAKVTITNPATGLPYANSQVDRRRRSAHTIDSDRCNRD